MEKIRKFFRTLRKTRRRWSARVHPMDCTEQESQGEGPLESEVKQVTVFFWLYKMLANASSFEPISLSVGSFYSFFLSILFLYLEQAEDSADGVSVAISAPHDLSITDGVAAVPSAPHDLSSTDGEAAVTSALHDLSSTDGEAAVTSALHDLSNTDGVAAVTSAPLGFSITDGVAAVTSAPLSLTETFESYSCSANDAKQGFKRQPERWPSCLEGLSGNISELQKSNKTSSQQQKKSRSKARRQKRQLEQLEEMLKEKTLVLEATEKALFQAQRQAKECRASHLAKGEPRKESAEKEVLQEQVAQLQRENLSLRQRLDDALKTSQARARTARQLQQELTEAVGKQQIAEASLKTSADLCDSLKNKISKLQEDLDKANATVCDLSAQLKVEHSELLLQKRANEELRMEEAVLKQRVEAAVADYKTSVQIGKKREEEMQEKLADSFRKQSMSENSRKLSEDYCRHLKNDISKLEEDMDKANVKVLELSIQLEMERQKSLELEMANRALQDLVHQYRPQATAVGCSPFSQNRRWHEGGAPKEMGQKPEPSRFVPAASQSRLEEINAAEAMFRKQQRQRIAALTSEMERAQSMHQESLRQIAHWQAGLDVSEKLFLVGEDIRRSLANKYDDHW
ncbi:ankyrin repeat domain-containing protein 26-like isoform X1 [Gallus gallus]|uniref:ankyrin repeat domain-containing protein 26-like isoform X1 n=2 Tax=Gallus gallus TaxID=9031 RepID=UPI001AE13C44|nr:ankyrin repeat domain-containing protein 26-like isoform X1 [Gallus gallus]